MATNKTVFFLIGILLIVLGASMLAPYALQILFSEGSHSFISASFVTMFIGILFILANLEKEFKLNLRQTFLFSSLAWIMVATFGSLPFLLSAQNFSFSEAFFESMSGITTTGATIIPDLDNSPKSILLWRAIMQWLGGIGIVVMAITILPLLKVGGMQLFKMEGPDSTEKILPRTIEVAAIIISTYITLTLLCGFFYWFFGMTIFDSVSHAMTTIATGGFSTHNDSIGFFKNSNIEIVASIFIILGSIPFISYLKFAQGNRRSSRITCWNVRDTIMDNAVFFKGWVIVRREFTGLKAPPHVDTDINNNRTWFHQLNHGLIDQYWCTIFTFCCPNSDITSH